MLKWYLNPAAAWDVAQGFHPAAELAAEWQGHAPASAALWQPKAG